MINLMHGDCVELLKTIPDSSIDMVLTDPPYGTTACKWDTVIPFEPMWKELKRITKSPSAIALFSIEPFGSLLRCSNLEMYKYDLVWQKNRIQHFAQAPYRFLTETEYINIFSKGGTAKNAKCLMKYYPQGLIEIDIERRGVGHSDHRPSKKTQANFRQTRTGYPKNIIRFASVQKTVHPTEKPVALLEYLIKTYTLEGETVLDFTAGSFSTGVACVNTNRNFIGIEKDKSYYDIGCERVQKAINDAQE